MPDQIDVASLMLRVDGQAGGGQTRIEYFIGTARYTGVLDLWSRSLFRLDP